ncbi:MAG: hypothetical protein ISEC1_P1576 [Thiomicrorhabdus sp.]|nr:MAG: hypothetical protein ISEC1_P1576 [Thiomicrorhabdus sp.]
MIENKPFFSVLSVPCIDVVTIGNRLKNKEINVKEMYALVVNTYTSL